MGSDPSMCTTPCTGDSTQICGGSGSWKDVFMLGKKDCVTIDKYSEHLICIKGNSRKIRNSIESLTEYNITQDVHADIMTAIRMTASFFICQV